MEQPIHGAEGMKYRFQWNFPSCFHRTTQTCCTRLATACVPGAVARSRPTDTQRSHAHGTVGRTVTKDNTAWSTTAPSSRCPKVRWRRAPPDRLRRRNGVDHARRRWNWSNVTPRTPCPSGARQLIEARRMMPPWPTRATMRAIVVRTPTAARAGEDRRLRTARSRASSAMILAARGRCTPERRRPLCFGFNDGGLRQPLQ